MLSRIIKFSLRNKFLIVLLTTFIIGFGLYSLSQISIGAVPDITNNQVQIITTSRNLSTQDVEQFITYPIELEMANLPGVEEIRSISKFGLSVVTIVFEDEMGSYLPRQLIAEKLESASQNIPEGFGSPTLGPITTGLGEIYQYILDVEPEYKDNYSITDLRTIQDWIVKRQLSGIPGVVEVNTWGGFLKQYEVAINTENLKAMEVSVKEVFEALENNNSIAGGGYIQKRNQAYFIRGEGLVNTLSDIENIVVTNKNGLPIYVKDIADVGFGHALRFGAITGNGEGEKVLGQVMMLKDENSKQVIEAVKERVSTISKTLPKGVYFNAFLDRSELINKTTLTVTENLVLGCLIVIFVVVLLLGNLRSGLVVASVIPLSLLFALSLMHIFDIDANLMSLGAIDFGIIIDGAVIIVEYIAFKVTQNRTAINALSIEERQDYKNEITYNGATKMMNSAVFGQLIILIVFIPILSLSGVEGKMFKPMALTFSFALIGAMILCFTYIPVLASWVLKPSKETHKNFSTRLINKLYHWYEIAISWALKSKRLVLGITSVLFIATIYLFTTIGGEFIPTLDEGDFVIQPVLKTGTSLDKTIAYTTQIENILLDKFPEVKQVVTRIGAAEVPTDPMSMEESDVIIVLKPKREWVSAKTKDELANKFKDALAVIPGMGVEFTQPIEMRFNELITGVRADIAIKIFGDDLSILSNKGNEIKSLVEVIPGAADVTVEKVEGLPQMNVKYKREKIARYGLNIQSLNEVISMGFAGKKVGSVFENERRFDLVVRLENSQRQDIINLKNLYVDLPNGGKIPLSELAEITYQKGAAKISRDDTRRRIVVGINVRNRDLQSVVDDVVNTIDEHIKLPTGYAIKYGGQFENLQSAKARLKVAVPIALVLILVLLYFAFGSAKDALLIFSAIPLAAVGGVLFLWIRDLPFSISAGVGFIALFGIAVLNGIVLIEHFKELQKQGIEDMETRVKQGTKDRLRAVLLTASAAALGFLPMAVSTSAGAEVQRPLATVVIGGLITATLLTLIVLPILYAIFNAPGRKIKRQKNGGNKKVFLVIPLLLLAFNTNAQESPMTLDQLIDHAFSNNAKLKAKDLTVKKSKAIIGSAFNFDKTLFYYAYDENNLDINNNPLKVLGIQQEFAFPTVYFASKKVNNINHLINTNNYMLERKKTEREVITAYNKLLFEREKVMIYKQLDSLFSNFSKAALRKFELGETNYLERITAESKHKQIQLNHVNAQQNVIIALNNLKKVVQIKDSLNVVYEPLQKMERQGFEWSKNEEILLYENNISLMKAKHKLETQQLLPDISLNYFQGTNASLNKNLKGIQVGLKIPVLFGASSSKIKASKISEDIALEQLNNINIQVESKYKELSYTIDQLEKALHYFETHGNKLSNELIKTSKSNFKNGEIDFYQYIISLEHAYELKIKYLETLNSYNQTVISLNYLTL